MKRPQMTFDDTPLDPNDVRAQTYEAEQMLWSFIADPDTDPVTASRLTLFLNSHMTMLGMLRAMVDIHNQVVALRDRHDDPSAPIDCTDALNKMALLAASAATGFGERIAHVVVRFNLDIGMIEFDNLTGLGCTGGQVPIPPEELH